jgi:hypothetical protein
MFARHDLWRLGMTAMAALLLFGLWFWLDPYPSQVLKDFVFRENAGKFNTGGESYFLNLVWGQSSLWRIVVSYPLDAGLLALSVVALFWDAWKRRRHLGSVEILLWIWMLVLAAFFCIPNQRDERYLLPGMPALALLLAIRLGHLPRWVVSVTLVVVGFIFLGLVILAVLLQNTAGVGNLYPLWAVVIPLSGLIVVLLGLFTNQLSRPLLAPAILLVYLTYTIFLIPLDHGPGVFSEEGIDSVSGCLVSVPANFNAREESYGFLLPGARMQPYDHWKKPPPSEFVVISLPLDQQPPNGVILGKRLNMIDRFNPSETLDMLSGNLTYHLFHWDWLVQQEVKRPEK